MTFQKAITVNTVYFWKSLDEGFKELHRVLTTGGRVVVGFLPKEFMDRMNMPADIFTPRTPDDIAKSMKNAGFDDVRSARPNTSTKWEVALGMR